MPKKIVIMGALGKDFHTFNTCFRGDPETTVLAFTYASEQNVGTTMAEGKEALMYPASLAGEETYPDGIPMIPEKEVEAFIAQHQVQEVVFAYSDVKHEELMHKASRCLAAGADFSLVSPSRIQLEANVPLISVCAVRTGCGKSQVSRAACRWFKAQGLRVVAIREPMPYGDLIKQKCMRFSKYEDFETYSSTVEEREEYEPYIEQGLVVYSGVDYEEIVREAEKEADVLIWDGGNNEVSFYKSDLLLCVVDPLRPGDELKYYPGEVNLRAADVFVVNKMNAVKDPKAIELVLHNLALANPSADILKTNSQVEIKEEDRKLVKGKKCVVVEDGPTTTHGDMSFGAGMAAAQKFKGRVVTPPKTALKGCMKNVFEDFPHIQKIVPAMGYTDEQRKDLMDTLNAIPKYDTIINGSPLDLKRLLPGLQKPVVRVFYDIEAYPKSLRLEDTLETFSQKYLKETPRSE